jgi:hypothetical protein
VSDGSLAKGSVSASDRATTLVMAGMWNAIRGGARRRVDHAAVHDRVSMTGAASDLSAFSAMRSLAHFEPTKADVHARGWSLQPAAGESDLWSDWFAAGRAAVRDPQLTSTVPNSAPET